MSHRARSLTLLFALLGFSAGCSRCNRTPPEAKTSPRNTITVGLASSVRTFDPRFAVQERDRRVMPLVHCSLFRLNAEGTLVPELASAAAQWMNATTVTVQLRKNVVFSDGTPVTARDVQATYDFHRSASLPTIQKIEFSDTDRITFILAKPDESFLQKLTMGILPAALAVTTSPLPLERVVGCGPYTLATSDTEGFLLQAHPRYALGGTPRTERLQFKIIGDESRRLARLRRKQLDLVPDVSDFNLVKELTAKDPALLAQRRPAGATTSLGFNVRDPILSQRTVRRAIAHTIDRRPIIDFVFAGFATPVHTVTGLDHDLARAAELLDAAGFKTSGGKPRFTLTLQSSTDVMQLHEAKAIAAQLEKVNIRVSVEARAETLPTNHPRVQLWLGRSREAEAQPFATAELTLMSLWREDVLAVQDKNIKGFVMHPNGSLASLVTAYRASPN